MMNDLDTAIRRLPAEWEKHGAVIMAWPHAETDWAPMLDEVTRCYVDIVRAITREESVIVLAPDTTIARQLIGQEPTKHPVLYLDVPTNDTWARDFGPITVLQSGGNPLVLDFAFNGWGLKFAANHDNMLTRAMMASGLLRATYCNRLGFVLEGGSIESDGRGLLLTTSECLLSPNRNGDMTRNEIERYLTDEFGLRKMLWLDHGALEGDDTDSHIDTLARLAPNDTIIYTGCDDPHDSHHEELQAMKRQLATFTTVDGMPFNLVELPLPDAVYDAEGMRLPATYANFLILDRSILMPTYRQPRKDRLASQILRIAFPDHEVVGIDCIPLIQQHGSLHCVTMQVPKEILPI